MASVDSANRSTFQPQNVANKSCYLLIRAMYRGDIDDRCCEIRQCKVWLQVNFIEMVDVRYCALEEQGLTSMLRALRANCTLSTLHLEGNNLTGKGIFILSEFLHVYSH